MSVLQRLKKEIDAAILKQAMAIANTGYDNPNTYYIEVGKFRQMRATSQRYAEILRRGNEPPAAGDSQFDAIRNEDFPEDETETTALAPRRASRARPWGDR